MRLAFDPNVLEDLRYWIDKDRRKALKIVDLIDATLKSPFGGIGKPEPLRFELAGCWSRRSISSIGRSLLASTTRSAQLIDPRQSATRGTNPRPTGHLCRS